MKKLIFNADDFGYSYGVNYGIIESHLRGVLTSTTLLAEMPGFDHAVALAKAHPTLGIGVHLALTCGRPSIDGQRTLVEKNGDFHNLSFYKQDDTVLDEDEVYAEWKMQIEKVIKAGIHPTHLDSHHHVHTFKNLENVFVRLAREYGLPVRNSKANYKEDNIGGIACPNCLIDFIESSDVHFSTPLPEYAQGIWTCMQRVIKEAFETLDCVEVMCHPAYLDTDVMLHSSFNLHRMCEVDMLTAPETKEFVAHIPDVTLASYEIFHQEARK